MSSLSLLNSLESMPFLVLSAIFSFVISAILIGIVNFSDKKSPMKPLHALLKSPQMIIQLKSPMIFLHMIRKLSMQNSMKLIINLLQKSEKLIHVMQAIPQRRRKSYRWLITDLIQSKKPAVMTLAGFRLKCTLSILLSKHSRMK